MSLLLVPEEVLAMGKLERDPKTHEPIFPETANITPTPRRTRIVNGILKTNIEIKVLVKVIAEEKRLGILWLTI